MVYVLIPGNDMNTTKTILGTVEKLGDDYINLDANIDRYEVLSGNLTPPVDREKEYGLCSYSYYIKDETLYTNANLEIETSSSEDNKEAFKKIIVDLGATHIKISAYFKTNLLEEQKNKGDYGLKLQDSDSDSKEYCTFSINQMEGNPYDFSTYNYQEFYFPIPEDFNTATFPLKLYFYKEGFLSRDGEPPDLFVKDCSVYLVKKIEGELLSSSLSLKVADGKSRFFSFPIGTTPIETRKLIPELKIKGATIKTGMRYYWFIEDSSIGPVRDQEGQKALQGYSPFGGVGWRCLNDIKVNNQQEQYATNQTTYTVTQDDILTDYVKYKCVVIYKGQSYSKEIVLGRTDNTKYTIDFSIDGGNPIKVDSKTVGMNIGTSNKGSVYKLSCILSAKDPNQLGKLSYNWIFSPSGDDTLTDIFSTDLNPNTIKIDTNKIAGNKAFYKVTIFNTKDDITECAGTATFTLYMTDEKEQSYLNIINGDQVFQYNEYGISPANENLHLNPQIIKELDFTLVVNQTTINFDEALIAKDSVVWVVPKENTLIDISGISEEDIEDETSEAGKILVYNHKTLPFKIKNNYNYNYYNNQIELRITHNRQLYTTRTNFTFLKQGDVGTNGTDTVCKIVPNGDINDNSKYPIIRIYNFEDINKMTHFKNWGHTNSPVYFNAQLWENGIKIFESSSSTNEYQVFWEVLQHKYSSDIIEPSFLKSTGGGGWVLEKENIAKYISPSEECAPSNIVKCTVKSIKTNKEYIAFFPVIFMCYRESKTVIEEQGVSINIDNLDIQQILYSSSGDRPIYNTNNAIEISLDKAYFPSSGGATSTTIRGSIYNLKEEKWKAQDNLSSKLETLIFEPKYYRLPTIVASEDFKGIPNNNAVEVRVTYVLDEDSTVSSLAYIHIPIHLYLNYYGLSSINGWDGNSIKIDEDGGYVLAPQMGAGIKDSNNQFTGVVMGTAKEANQTKEQIGLFGFSKGLRSFFLDAETGRAEFGTGASGKIIIDPQVNEVGEDITQLIIKSNDFYEDDANGKGLEINFTAPSIKFGNGNFSVDSNGFTTMRKAEIGGGKNPITIGTSVNDISCLYYNKTGFDKDTGHKGFYLGTDGLEIGDQDSGLFQVDSSTGRLFATNADIKGKITATSGVIGSSSNPLYIGKQAIYTGNDSEASGNIDYSGFYLGYGNFVNKEANIVSNVYGLTIGGRATNPLTGAKTYPYFQVLSNGDICSVGQWLYEPELRNAKAIGGTLQGIDITGGSRIDANTFYIKTQHLYTSHNNVTDTDAEAYPCVSVNYSESGKNTEDLIVLGKNGTPIKLCFLNGLYLGWVHAPTELLEEIKND